METGDALQMMFDSLVFEVQNRKSLCGVFRASAEVSSEVSAKVSAEVSSEVSAMCLQSFFRGVFIVSAVVCGKSMYRMCSE